MFQENNSTLGRFLSGQKFDHHVHIDRQADVGLAWRALNRGP